MTSPLIAIQHSEPWQVNSGAVQPAAPLEVFPAATPGWYYNIELLIVAFYYSTIDLSNGCTLYVQDPGLHFTEILKLGQDTPIDGIFEFQNQIWTNEQAFSTTQGMAVSVDNVGGLDSSNVKVTAFGWLVQYLALP